MQKELVVIYRAYGGELNPADFKPGRVHYFNKLKCWKSFHDSFAGKADIYVVWDGPGNEFLDYIKCFQVNVRRVDFKDNQKSLLECYSLARGIECQNYAFIEDDWLFLPDAADILIEGLNIFKGHFVWPYDSPHRYNPVYQDITYGHDYIHITRNSHWRTAESVMCSVAMGKNLFTGVYNLLLKHCKEGTGGPNDRPFFRECLKYDFRTWTSIPGQCTHMMNSDLGLFVNWEEFNNEIVL